MTDWIVKYRAADGVKVCRIQGVDTREEAELLFINLLLEREEFGSILTVKAEDPLAHQG